MVSYTNRCEKMKYTLDTTTMFCNRGRANARLQQQVQTWKMIGSRMREIELTESWSGRRCQGYE
jgi:hypothetical protein